MADEEEARVFELLALDSSIPRRVAQGNGSV